MQYYSGNNLLSTDSLNTKDLVVLISPNNQIKPYTKYAKIQDFVKAINGNIDNSIDINKKYKQIQENVENTTNTVANLSLITDIFDYETQKYKPATISNDINELSNISDNLIKNNINVIYNVNNTLSMLRCISYFLNNSNDNNSFDINTLSNTISDLQQNYEYLSSDLYNINNSILSIETKLLSNDFITKKQLLTVSINNINNKTNNLENYLIDKLSSIFIGNNKEL